MAYSMTVGELINKLWDEDQDRSVVFTTNSTDKDSPDGYKIVSDSEFFRHEPSGFSGKELEIFIEEFWY